MILSYIEMREQIHLQTLTCKRCGNNWIPRVISKQCPKCKSYHWNEDREVISKPKIMEEVKDEETNYRNQN